MILSVIQLVKTLPSVLCAESAIKSPVRSSYQALVLAEGMDIPPNSGSWYHSRIGFGKLIKPRMLEQGVIWGQKAIKRWESVTSSTSMW